MIRTKLFRRHFAITTFVLILFIVLGFVISDAIMRSVTSHQSSFGAGPSVMFARWIDDVNLGGRVQAMHHIEQVLDKDLPGKFWILDENGKSLSNGEPLPFLWETFQKPMGPYEYVPLEQGPFSKKHTVNRPHPENGLIRFPGIPAQYLYFSRNSIGGPSASILFVTVGSLLLSVIAGVGFALFLLFRSMKDKMTLADLVISDLQQGNLKARFPIHRMDEMGQTMSRFNKMADEIERLVEQIKRVEKSRMILLQDLTHDLRTPVASLKNLLATVEKKNSPLDLALRTELLSLSRKEVDYFERLLEDLLVLAQVSEPDYRAEQESVSVVDLLDDGVWSVEKQANGHDGFSQKKIEIKTRLSPQDCWIVGDRHLLRRLIRNALENAFSFAKSEVIVLVEIFEDRKLRLLIHDDGPGLSEAALSGFGERRVSRVIEKRSKGERLSVGLGSVIMKTVAEMHRGKVVAGNRVTPSGEVLGAEIQIILPRVLISSLSV